MRYVLISDVHANLEALKAVEQAAQRISRPASPPPYWFLGDILGYGPDPLECLRWLRLPVDRVADRWVPGNHDMEIVRMATAPGPTAVVGAGTEPQERSAAEPASSDQARASWRIHYETLRRPENQQWWAWLSEEVERTTTEEVHSLVEESHGDLLCLFVHGSALKAGRRTQYLYPWGHHLHSLRADLQQIGEAHGEHYRTVCLLHGHTHYPSFAVLSPDGSHLTFRSITYGEPMSLGQGCIAINPGSVGQPRDGDPRAAFAILDTAEQTITFHRVMYDVQSTVKKLEERGYPASLVRLLMTANGGADLVLFRTTYQAPDLQYLKTVGDYQ